MIYSQQHLSCAGTNKEEDSVCYPLWNGAADEKPSYSLILILKERPLRSGSNSMVVPHLQLHLATRESAGSSWHVALLT